MIDFSEEHDAFRAVVRDFARRELAPNVDRWEAAAELPLDAVAAMAELGLFGIVFPEEWGGSGGDFTSLCIAIEEIGVGQPVARHHAVGRGRPGRQPDPLRSAPTTQKARWLPDLVAGAAPRRLRPHRARRRQRRRRHAHPRSRATATSGCIDGAKAFITNSGTPITSIVTVTARTDDGEISVVHRARPARPA